MGRRGPPANFAAQRITRDHALTLFAGRQEAAQKLTRNTLAGGTGLWMAATAMTTAIRAGRMWMMDRSMARPSLATEAEVRFGPADAAALRAGLVSLGEAAVAELAGRLTSGRQAYTAWVGEALAAVGWASLRPEYIGEQGLWVHLRPGEAYLWDCVTLPAFRQRGLYRGLLAYMARALLDAGLTRLWIGADLDNAASQRGIAGAGFQPIVDLLLLPLPQLQVMWLEGLPRASAAQVAAATYALFGKRPRPPRR
jgi:RimJ/RimL family protein N-acetyltransferase